MSAACAILGKRIGIGKPIIDLVGGVVLSHILSSHVLTVHLHDRSALIGCGISGAKECPMDP